MDVQFTRFHSVLQDAIRMMITQGNMQLQELQRTLKLAKSWSSLCWQLDFNLLQIGTAFFLEHGYNGSLSWQPGNVWRRNLPLRGFCFLPFPIQFSVWLPSEVEITWTQRTLKHCMDNVACAAGKSENNKNYNSCVNASAMENKYICQIILCASCCGGCNW